MPEHTQIAYSAPSNVQNRQSGKHLLKMQAPTKECTVSLTRRESTILDKSAFQAWHVMHCASWCTPPAAMPTKWIIHSAMSLPPHVKKINKFFGRTSHSKLWSGDSVFITLYILSQDLHPVSRIWSQTSNITLTGKTYFPISYEYICGRSMRHVTGSIWYNNTWFCST